MKIVDYNGFCTLVDEDSVRLLTYDHFPTLDSLENHLKLMLATVQNYKEKHIE